MSPSAATFDPTTLANVVALATSWVPRRLWVVQFITVTSRAKFSPTLMTVPLAWKIHEELAGADQAVEIV
jgi:hypothetical protein